MEDITEKTYTQWESNYKLNVDRISKDISESKFYASLRDKLVMINGEYKKNHRNIDLINFDKTIKIDKKNFNNLIEKCYRWDVLENEKWNDNTEEWQKTYEWCFPPYCYEKIPDLVRTRITVRYIDGVDIVINSVKEIAMLCGLEIKDDYFSEDSGYYAVHLDVKYPVTIITLDWDTKQILMNFEIQITTQIKEVVNEMLHEYYEYFRLNPIKDENWRWDWQYINFIPSYLGHISHYVEGMILQAREKIKVELYGNR